MFPQLLHLFLNSREKTLGHHPLIPRSSLCSKSLTSKRLRTVFPSLMRKRAFSILLNTTSPDGDSLPSIADTHSHEGDETGHR